MRRKTTFALLLALLLLLSAGCQPVGESSPATDYADMMLTKEQMLADYDAMWEAFQENSPFFGVMRRNYGIHYFEDIVSEYRRQIEAMEADGDAAMLEFIMIIAYSLSDMYVVDRHTGILNADRYFAYRTAYRELVEEIPELAPWLDVMEKPQVESFYQYYDYLMELMMAEYLNEPDSLEEESPQEAITDIPNLTLEILTEGQTAYIQVASFDSEYMAHDLPQIRAFLEDIGDYEHLIIDIRENGGGNTGYWEEAFVQPNLAEPAVETSVRLMKDSALARQFYGPDYEDSSLTIDDLLNNPAYTALQRDDMQELALARAFTSITEPESSEPLYQGAIWVLIGPEVYSSAENFAVFCKATGFATLVGQTSGGGNTGGPVWYELPNSHLLVSFDVEYALNPDGSCTQEIGTTPDIEAEDALHTVLALIAAEAE